MALSYKEVAEIIKLIDASACDELILELEGTKLVVRRGVGSDGASASRSTGNVTSVSPTPVPSSTGAGAPPASASPETKRPAAHETREDGLVEMRAPMVGTFYRAPSPTESPFVEIGDVVEVGDAIALIEVMKLFTTIEAQHAGRIVEIGAENGALVEYDQMLFVIEPS